MTIDYRSFMQDNFFIKNKEGIIVPMVFNPVQNLVYDSWLEEWGEELQGIRENDLKGRQFGISSLIEGIFATDFILSELKEIPIVDSDVYSHIDKETKAHTDRFNLYLESYLMQDQGASIEDMESPEGMKAREAFRKSFLKTDNGNYIESKRGALYHSQTASAKVSGRGGTKQNIHWTEPAFYPNTDILNAKELMTGAEKQVPLGRGKIFRESTGKTRADYFGQEYYKGKGGRGRFKSRFLAWYLHPEYQQTPPSGWVRPEYYSELPATDAQCYWHYLETDNLTDKLQLREYPTFDHEAFIAGGESFFDATALMEAINKIVDPIKRGEYVSSL